MLDGHLKTLYLNCLCKCMSFQIMFLQFSRLGAFNLQRSSIRQVAAMVTVNLVLSQKRNCIEPKDWIELSMSI